MLITGLYKVKRAKKYIHQDPYVGWRVYSTIKRTAQYSFSFPPFLKIPYTYTYHSSRFY